MGAKNRESFLQEQILREYVRKAIKTSLKKRETKIFEEQKLRNLVRSLIKEVEVPEEVPHNSTGINVLEELLKKIVPILEDAYKGLTSNTEQRQSFRAHVIQAVQNALAPSQVFQKAGKEKDQINEIDINVEDNDEAAFIDVDRPGKKDVKPSKDDIKSDFTIHGQDLTGRNVALKTFEMIERNIIDAYDVLSDENDRQLFYDYLLTNLKLYFDKFEDEISTETPDELTTDEYEQEVSNQEQVPQEEEEELDFSEEF